MIAFRKALVAAVSLASLAVFVSLMAPRTGYGQNGNGNGNGQQPQSVRAFDAPRVAYDSRLQLSFDDGHNVTGGDFNAVPPGKQLIVTFASGFAHMGTATRASFRILKSDLGGSTAAIHELKPVATDTVGGVVAGEPLQMVVNAGERLSGIVARNSLTGTDGDIGMTISGYLVNVP